VSRRSHLAAARHTKARHDQRKESRVREHPAPHHDVPQSKRRDRQRHDITSREVSAAATYLRLARLLVDEFPECGTPAWAALGDDDPRWWAGLAYAALQHVLDQDIHQEAEREASRTISAAVDWGEFSRQMSQRRSVYIIPRRSA
jgi:hypothetical protein